MRRLQPRIAARATALCALASAAAYACSGSTPATTPTIDAAAPTATATPPPADSTVAARLRDAGNYAAAIDVYAAVVAQSTGAQRQAARLSQAQLLLRARRTAEARPVLDAYLAGAGRAADASAARYMLASALDDLGDLPGAVAGYDAYIAANGPLADFARLERAKLLARQGSVAGAQAAAEQVLAGPLADGFKSSFTFSFAKALQIGGADREALAWYVRAKDSDPPTALARIAAIKKRLGDATWAADELEALAGYPEAAVAPDLLDELDAAQVRVSDEVRGVVDYRAGRRDDARVALTRAAAATDHPAEAAYYLAAMDEAAGDTADAITGYARAHDLDPASPLADDALWWRGRLLEQAGRYAEAGAAYGALVDGYPFSTWADEAAFHSGLALYRAGDDEGAALAWSAIATESDENALRARYWQGRALFRAGDAQATPLLSRLLADAPGSYYALRAEVLLKRNDTKKEGATIAPAAIDWDRIAAYVRDATGADPRTSIAAADARWDVARELRAVGLTAQAGSVSSALLSDHKDDAAYLYAAARAATNAGDVSLAARAATTLLSALPASAAAPSADLLRVAYPPAYSDLATEEARREGISPLLLLALVRQESYFDADAGSPAGALGLTQVVPATGAAIAAKLGIAPFAPEDLYRPQLSLLFGASYLGDQLKAFDGDVYRALAAYNAGPGTAGDAARAAGDDEDLFVEDLEFDEAKQYVRRVLEHYARYRQLYADIDRPSLPR